MIYFLVISLFLGQSYKVPDIREILKRPEAEIDIGEAALVLAKDFYPDLNIPHFLYAFDYMAKRFNALLGSQERQDPENKVLLLNTYLYQKGWWNDSISFTYDDEDYYLNGFQGVRKISNRFINGYIATKKGSCITMPMLYLIIAERLGLPIYPVLSPKHFFLRYIPEELSGSFESNIEATNGGSFLSDEAYINDAKIPKKAIRNGVYLKTLTKKEYLAALLAMNGTLFLRKGEFEKGRSYLWLALKYHDKLAMAHWNYGYAHLERGRKLEERLQNEIESAFYSHMKQKIAKDPLAGLEWRQSNPFRASYPAHILMPGAAASGKFQDVIDDAILNNPVLSNFYGFREKRSPNLELMKAELEKIIIDTEKQYKKEIIDCYKTAKKFMEYAEYLGIVKKFPTEFFEKQLKMFKLYVKEGRIKL